MLCKTCGKDVVDDSVFCPYCGNALFGENSVDNKTNIENISFDDDYYKKKANKTAGDKLMAFSKRLCFISLVFFLIFNIKMSPSYGWGKFFIYVGTAIIAIVVAIWFGWFLLDKKNKSIHILSVIMSVMAILSCIGLRIVYESKVDMVMKQIPKSEKVLVSLSTKTDYFSKNFYGGIIHDPDTEVKIGDKSDEYGDKFQIVLNKKYPLRIEAGGSGNKGFVEDIIVFDNSFVTNGQYVLTKTFDIDDDAEAEVDLTFKRFCTFWEVILY